MRRKDREIVDRNAIDNIISRCEVCRIALGENGQPYVLPLNFGFDGKHIYFHSASYVIVVRVNIVSITGKEKK